MGFEVKVLVASEDAGYLDLMALVLQNQKNVTLIGEASNWRELSSLVTTLQPDVVLLDTDAPGNGAAAVIKTARLKRLPTAFMGLVGEMYVESALLNQLDAVILKSDPFREMTSTILAVASKGKYSQRGYRPGFKTLFAETRRQYPKPENHQDPHPSSTPHPANEISLADHVSHQANPENSCQGSAPSTVEAEPYRPTQATVSRPTWERDADGSMDGSQTSSILVHDGTQATTACDIAILHQQPSPWCSSEKSAAFETAQQDENSRNHEEPIASETQGEKQSSIVSNGGIKRDKPESGQSQLRDEGYGTLASYLEAMRAALASDFTASHPSEISTNGSIEARKPETVATITEEAAEQSTESVELEPAQYPPSVQSSNNDVEATLKKLLPSSGSIVLLAYPFASFRSLGKFQRALEKLDGVRSTRIRRFNKGTLYAIVRFVGTNEQFKERLKNLVQFDPQIIDEKPDSIELRVNVGDDHLSNE